MKEVIIYGGAFNPPTKAHQAILQACVDRAEKNNGQVWVMPSGSRYDKTIERTNDSRLLLVDALIKSVTVALPETVQVDTYDLDKPEPTETFETHMYLTNTYPEREFKWVFGTDSVATMNEWRRGAWMLQNLGILIVPRPGVLLESMPPKAEIFKVETGVVSSTEVRRRIDQRLDISEYVPPEVQRVLESVA